MHFFKVILDYIVKIRLLYTDKWRGQIKIFGKNKQDN
jgi:hypothetical protein